MKVKVMRTDALGLEAALNNIGYENVLQILNERCYDGELYNIIYKDKTSDAYNWNQYPQPHYVPWQPNMPINPWPNDWNKIYCGDIQVGSDSTNSGVYVHIDSAKGGDTNGKKEK